MSDLDIRPVGPEDKDDLASLFVELKRHYFGENPEMARVARVMAEKITDGTADCHAVIGRIDGRPVACATYTTLLPGLNEHGTLFMKDLYTSRDARGQGIGEKMMAHMAGLAVELGCPRFDWTAETDNPGALRFYDTIGAERVEEKVYFRFSGANLARFGKNASK